MKELINIAKIGSSNATYPAYAPYVTFTGEEMVTCNDSIYVSLDYPSEFKGSTNIFVLSSILEKVENPAVIVNKDKMVIKEGSFKTTLPMMDIQPKYLKFPETLKTIEITPTLYDVIKLALKFTNNKLAAYKYIALNKRGVYATDGSRGFVYTTPLNLESPIFLDSSILKALTPGCQIGSLDGNVYVMLEYGFVVFTISMLSITHEYPFEKIDALTKMDDRYLPLISRGDLTPAIDKISPILFSEKRRICIFNNSKQQLTISAESAANGESQVSIDSLLSEDYKSVVSIDLLQNIPDTFTLYVNHLNDKDIKVRGFAEDKQPIDMILMLR